ncbi:DUF3237 domain-containing protein, partial [Mycolicibacterium wolinskyi]|uniref:DUF3237 domain-containing protein n=1 Tax=Mycolicibacterium wolinskyi TaxID=59750 RepID=UPI0021F36A3B
GKVTGNRFSGTAAPGGGDWLLAGEDGYGRLDVRAQFYTDDGAVIYMSYQGLVEVTEAAADALGGATTGTDFGDHYFVTTPRLESGHPKYKWVNQTIFVGQGRIQPGPIVEFQVFRVTAYHPKYKWVNQTIFVGQGRIQPGPIVEFQVFRVTA